MAEQTTLTKTQFQHITVSTTDRIRFIELICTLAASGAVLKDSTVPRLSINWPFQVQMTKPINSLEDVVKSSPGVHAHPVDHVVYSELELTQMVWLDFREACATQGVKGRDRTIMLEKYLEVVKNR